MEQLEKSGAPFEAGDSYSVVPKYQQNTGLQLSDWRTEVLQIP